MLCGTGAVRCCTCLNTGCTDGVSAYSPLVLPLYCISSGSSCPFSVSQEDDIYGRLEQIPYPEIWGHGIRGHQGKDGGMTCSLSSSCHSPIPRRPRLRQRLKFSLSCFPRLIFLSIQGDPAKHRFYPLPLLV